MEDIFECLICGYESATRRGLFIHVRKLHKTSTEDYYDQFGLRKFCSKCHVKLRIGYGGKSGLCKKCSDKNHFGENNPMFGKRVIQTDEMNEKRRIASKNKWKDEDYRNRVITNSSKPRNESFGREQSKRVKEWYENNPEQRSLRSERMKKSWKDGEIEPHLTPINESNPERKLRSLLIDALPTMQVYKKTLKNVNGKWLYPDITINDRYIIEFFGRMWHADPRFYKDPEQIVHHSYTAKSIWRANAERIQTLEKLGFNVKIVWETDFKKNEMQVVNEIKEWISSFNAHELFECVNDIN